MSVLELMLAALEIVLDRGLPCLLCLMVLLLPPSSLAEDSEGGFDAASIMAAYKAETVGCGGIDVDGSKLDEEVRDRRCAVMNGYAMMLEDHGYCFDDDKAD